MSPLARKVLLLTVATVIALSTQQCAEQAPPPGGEPDKTGPRLLATEPASGAVSVPTSDRIILHFSEYVVEPRTKDAVFITPRQSEPVDLHWHGDRLEIELAQPFQDNTTYIVSVSSAIADLRGNKLDSSMSMAFATGPTIDSGRVSGIVLDKDKPVTGVLVGLYDRARIDSTTAFDTIFPDYLAQTNSSGRFDLNYLPNKEYRLIAFQDKNRDEMFDIVKERWAVPIRSVNVQAQPPMDSLYLVLAPTKDTALPEIISAAPVSGEMLKIRLSSEIDLTGLSNRPGDILLSSLENVGQYSSALGFLEFRSEKSASLNAYFGPLEDTLYGLEITYNTEMPPATMDTVVIVFPEDTEPPIITSAPFDDEELFLREVDLHIDFGEPIDTALLTPETFTLFNESEVAVPLTWQSDNPFSVKLVPQALAEAQTYTLEMVEFEIGDLAGNLLGDSLTEYGFSTYDPEELGSISGTVSILLPGFQTAPFELTFTRVSDETDFDLTVSGSSFNVTVPPGKYLLHGFADDDADGERDLGAIHPERYAEPIDWYPDTIAVRARFETAGIDFIIQ